MRLYSIIFLLLTKSALEVSCDCGRVIIPGNDVVEFPWMVQIVDILPNNELSLLRKCVGSLISPSVVVTAASCFYNETSSSKIDADKKAVRAYDPTEEDNEHYQISHIKTIHLAHGYEGRKGFYAKNIAWLILKNPFSITSHVRTVCIDSNNEYECEDLQREQIDTIRHRLFLLSPEGGSNIISRDKCISTLPEEFRSFITADKFCARAPSEIGQHLYAGMGFNSKHDGRWYIRGVLNDPSSYITVGENMPLTGTNIGRFIHEMERNLDIKKCGVITPPVNPLIVGEHRAETGGYPWHVTVYHKDSTGFYFKICGGSLISPNVIISAAHCFYDELMGQLKNANDYAVAAGKHKRSYDWAERFVQKSPVDTIHIPIGYHGMDGLYAGDIAWLILKNPFHLSAFVTPICLESNSRHGSARLQNGQVGKIASWGLTTNDMPSDEPKEITAIHVPHDECILALPRVSKPYVTLDKFCARSVNETRPCSGDGGGGLVYHRDGRWYLRGIVSVKPVFSMTCNDPNSYTVFTDVVRYTDELFRFTNITTHDLI